MAKQKRRSVSLRRALFDRLDHFVKADPSRNYCNVVDLALTEYLDKHGALGESEVPPASPPRPVRKPELARPESHPMANRPSVFSF